MSFLVVAVAVSMCWRGRGYVNEGREEGIRGAKEQKKGSER